MKARTTTWCLRNRVRNSFCESMRFSSFFFAAGGGNWTRKNAAGAQGPARRLPFLDAIEVRLRPHEQRLAGDGGRGHAARVELVGRHHVRLSSGREHVSLAVLIEEVQVSIGADGGRAVVAAQSLCPHDIARLRLDA